MRAGNADALKELYNLFYNSLFAANFAVCLRRDLVKDSIHDAFINIWTTRTKLPNVNSVGAYLATCVRRRLIDTLRKESPLESSLQRIESGHELSYEEVIIAFQEEQATRQTLEEALSYLSNRQKEVIRLRFFENKNYEEIAQLLDCEPRTIYNHIYQAVERLRHYFSARYTS